MTSVMFVNKTAIYFLLKRWLHRLFPEPVARTICCCSYYALSVGPSSRHTKDPSSESGIRPIISKESGENAVFERRPEIAFVTHHLSPHESRPNPIRAQYIRHKNSSKLGSSFDGAALGRAAHAVRLCSPDYTHLVFYKYAERE